MRSASEMILQLKQDQAALERAKERFLEVIGHELRTPLTSSVASLEILEHEVGDQDPLREWVKIASASTARLTDIVGRIEEMVSLESTLTKATLQVLGLDEAIEELRRRIPALVAEREVRCSIAWPDVPIGIATSREHLVRLLELLVENGLQFTACGRTVAVRCEIVLAEDEEDHVLFQVVDDGPGIPDEDMDRIFDCFHQVHHSKNGKPDGLGLGLSICRSLAASLGSEIVVRRRSGTGTVFAFTLPCLFRSPEDRRRAVDAGQRSWIHDVSESREGSPQPAR